MTKRKQPALYSNIAIKQYKLYDWMEINSEKDNLIAENYPDPLETVENEKIVSKDQNNIYSLIKPVCPYCNFKKISKTWF